MKQAIASAMPMHATQTTRQASHPSRLPSSFFGERSAEARFEVLVAMPPNLRSLICEGLGQAALGHLKKRGGGSLVLRASLRTADNMEES
jgi:hypothetical protein